VCHIKESWDKSLPLDEKSVNQAAGADSSTPRRVINNFKPLKKRFINKQNAFSELFMMLRRSLRLARKGQHFSTRVEAVSIVANSA
jgi:hypothetical protein